MAGLASAAGSCGRELIRSRTAERTLIERWNGRTWAIVASPTPGRLGQYPRADRAGRHLPSDAWAVGNDGSGGIVQTLTEHWNGRAWTHVAD